MHTDGSIGGAGPAGHHADAGLAGKLAVGGRHETGAAFIAAQHEIQRALGVVQRVEHRQITFTRHAVGGPCAKRFQARDQQLAPVSCHVK